MLLFLHIPKTAGSTLNYIIKNNFGDSAQEVRWHWTTWITKNELRRKLADKNCDKKRLVHGHFVYGIHEMLGQQDARYLTFFRDPLKRAVSAYFHVRRDPKSRFHKEYREGEIGDFLLDPRILENDNGLVRRIAGIGDEVPYGQINTGHFNQAKDNIDRRFLAVGLTEKFDLSIELFRSLGVFKNVYYWKQNISKNNTTHQDGALDDSVINKFKSINSLDFELYNYCFHRFNESVTDLKFSQSSFNVKNRLYNFSLLPMKVKQKLKRAFK